MPTEIERKFLVKKDIWENSEKGEKHFLRQGYITMEPDKTVRIRLKDKQGYITIKGATQGATRSEYEYSIPEEDAENMLNEFCDAELTKYRYLVKYADKLWEVDEFLGTNAGLMIAEIELKSEDESFDLPDWADKEVTGDKKYYNARLSTHPFQEWSS